MKKLIYLLMTLLGFGAVSCEQITEEVAAEYGVPHVNFSLKARVVDEAGEPIEGIKVRVDWVEEYTNQDGEISINDSVYTWSINRVRFEDVDGEENGGEFETLTLDITDKVEKTEDGYGGWYDGAYKAELGDVTLTLKTEATEVENQ